MVGDDYVYYARHEGGSKQGPYSNEGDAWKAVMDDKGTPLPGAQVWPVKRGVYHEDGRPTALTRTVDERLEAALAHLRNLHKEVQSAQMPPDARSFQERILVLISKALGDAA